MKNPIGQNENPFGRNRGILQRIAGHARLRRATTNIFAQEIVPTRKNANSRIRNPKYQEIWFPSAEGNRAIEHL